jgi:hypothetical protein
VSWVLSGSSSIAGEPVRAAFDGGRPTSDAGVLLLAEVERRLGIAERLARCLEGPRTPGRVRHTLAEMIRFRVLPIAAGYPDANDRDALRADPAFEAALGRAPESGGDLCSQPTMCRPENLPGTRVLKRMVAATVELFRDSFEQVPRRGDQRQAGGGGPAPRQDPGRGRGGVGDPPRDQAYPRPPAQGRGPGAGRQPPRPARRMAWCERERVGHVLGLAGNRALLGRVAGLAEAVALGRVEGGAEKSRRFGELRYAAKTWHVERGVIARVEASAWGVDSRFVVTGLAGTPRWLHEVVYCARGRAENLVKAHKPHLASDRTSCTRATADQFRLVLHTAAHWLLHTLRGLAPKRSFWREARFDTLRLALVKVAARIAEPTTRTKVALPSSYPYRASLVLLAAQAARPPCAAGR